MISYGAFHGEDVVDTAQIIDGYVGSPMYDVISSHGPGLVAAALLVIGVWWMRRAARKGRAWATPLIDGYRSLPTIHRFLAWLLAIAGAVHLGLVFGHEPGVWSVLYGVDGAVFFVITRRLLSGRRWRRWAGLWLIASIFGYVVTTMAGEPPDQAGLATKLVELTAFAIVITPRHEGRMRRLGAATGTAFVAVMIAFGAWVGAFGSGDGGHHLGEVPQPGTLLPPGTDRDPTSAEASAAEEFYLATLATTQKYADPEVARADGYLVDGMYGTDFHAEHPVYKTDGRIFDPDRPENLLYAVTDAGPVITGVMYEMEEVGESGPAIGGPLTVWHAHDHICFSLTPPALSGLTSPFGVCPVGSITMPITNEMIHVWTLPGAPEKYGHLEDEWLAEYLASVAQP